ncbi:MAG: methyl-galactoside ABC transporter substrate-binding protein, partial [Lachnospiraceae bacterium]
MKRKTVARMLAVGLAVVMVAGMATGCRKKADPKATDKGDKKESSSVMIGSAIYKFDDTFMTGVRTAMTDEAKAEGAELELV